MGRPKGENKLSNAERCRKYREKNKEAYQKADNLRKKWTRSVSKSNPPQEKASGGEEASTFEEETNFK